MRKEYLCPRTTLIATEGLCVLDGLNSNFREDETDDMNVFLDETETASPEESLSKWHNSLWDDDE